MKWSVYVLVIEIFHSEQKRMLKKNKQVIINFQGQEGMNSEKLFDFLFFYIVHQEIDFSK